MIYKGLYSIKCNYRLSPKGVGNSNSIYKSNPLENPKVEKDVIENPDEVAYAQSERIRYHEHLEQKKAMLKDEITNLQNDGYSMEDIARMKVEQRNQDRINNYIKSNNYDGLEAMKQRNLEEYQRAEGPTADQLYKKMVHGKRLFIQASEVILQWM